MVELGSHPRSFHRNPQSEALQGISLHGYRQLRLTHGRGYVRETPSTQPTDRSNPSAITGTDLCTNELLEGLYGAKPTMMILSTQPTINISMEEMNMAISEHSTGSYSLLFPPWGTCLSRCL